MMPILSILLAVMQIPVPTGVNGSVLGEPQQFQVDGPARICFLESAFDLLAGETSYLTYLGIHSGGISIVGPNETYEIDEGNWAKPKRRGQEIPGTRTKVIRHRQPGKIAFLVYAPPGPDRVERPLIWVKRKKSAVRKLDKAILDRLNLAPDGPDQCARKFAYGWNFFEEDE